MIDFQHMSFSYDGEHQALRWIDLHIYPGEFVSIVGCNGSGKSTLARHINALLLPTAGTVSVAGFDTKAPGHLFDIRRRVGMVFQNPDDQLVASLVENEVAFGPRNLGLPDAEVRARVTWALESCQLAGFENTSVDALSGGQKQRLALAGALAVQPEILVLDEATSMLDPQGRTELMSLIAQLHHTGMTVILITHSTEEAAQTQRTIVLEDGAIIADGQSGDILINSNLLEKAGLEPPFTVRLSTELNKRGIPIEPTLSLDACQEALCRWF